MIYKIPEQAYDGGQPTTVYREVEGDAIGALAIRLEPADGRWHVDHLPTGRLVCVVYTEADARLVAESVQIHADWQSESPTVPPPVALYLREVGYQHRAYPYGGQRQPPPDVTWDVEFYASMRLTPRDLWPDGDWPEAPTAADVRQVIAGTGPRLVLTDWDTDSLVTYEVETVRPYKKHPLVDPESATCMVKK